MKLINTYNYEEYIIDYIDGTLSHELKTEMEEFLHLNPEIKREINEISKITIIKESISFSGKENLYKDIDANIYEDNCIAYIEKQLSNEAKNKFEIESSIDSTKHSILEEYKKTILIADENIIFENKDRLKQNLSFNFRRILNFSAAALIISLFSISILIIPSYVEQPIEISKQNKITNTNTNKEITIKENTFATNNIDSSSPTIKEVKKVQEKEQKRIRLVVSGNKLNTEPIIAEVNIKNLIVSNDIPINNTKFNSSNNIMIKMSNEISLNNNATTWSEENIDFNTKTKKQAKIIKKSKFALRSIIGKYFYTKRISHKKEIIIE